jgi:hypothetical protein
MRLTWSRHLKNDGTGPDKQVHRGRRSPTKDKAWRASGPLGHKDIKIT